MLVLCLAGRSSELDAALIGLLTGHKKKFELVDLAGKLAALGLDKVYPDTLWPQHAAVRLAFSSATVLCGVSDFVHQTRQLATDIKTAFKGLDAALWGDRRPFVLADLRK